MRRFIAAFVHVDVTSRNIVI